MMQVLINGVVGAGKFALVDPADYPLVARHSWHYREGYAITKIDGKEVRMHRFIMNETDPEVIIDHKDRNRLNNTRKNLRKYNRVQNANNRSDNVKIECFGETNTIAEWSRHPMCQVSYNVLRSRIYNGVPTWAAILAPKH
jgi:hypothetical protein